VWGLRKPIGSPATAQSSLFMQETDLISDNGEKGFLSACLKREQCIFPYMLLFKLVSGHRSCVKLKLVFFCLFVFSTTAKEVQY